MGKTTGIEWTGSTWNPWRGCVKVSAGCKNCYMFRDQERYGRDPRVVVRAAPATFGAPLRWQEPGLVFTCSWSDWFIEAADPWRDEAWEIVRRTPHLTYQILTKRPENIATRLPADWGAGWPNVWLGISAEDQPTADKRIPVLLATPAAVRFVSAEPLIGPIDLTGIIEIRSGITVMLSTVPQVEAGASMQMRTRIDALAGYNNNGRHARLDWIITGGESGPNCRPANQEWFRSIRDQCKAAGVPLFHKQNGGSARIDGHWGGRLLDGRAWDGMPATDSATPYAWPATQPALMEA